LLTISANSSVDRYLGKLLLCISVSLLVLCNTAAYAAVVTVVLSEDTAPYQETSDAIETALGPEHTVIKVLANKLAISDSALSRASLLVTVGVKAAELVASRGGKTPLLAVLVTEDWYQNQGSARLVTNAREIGVVVLEQPLSRQLLLIKRAFPDASKVGVVVGRKNASFLEELQTAARSQDLTLVGAVAESESTLVTTLGQVLREADLLLAVPDPEVLNRNTVQSVLITTYRYRDPLVGYSKALSRAGALISLYSTPAQIGRQTGEIASRALNGGPRLSGLMWPKYFSITVNDNVARSLGIDLPSVETLLSELGNGND
jgi:putative ABC transport system substrate-binding protein